MAGNTTSSSRRAQSAGMPLHAPVRTLAFSIGAAPGAGSTSSRTSSVAASAAPMAPASTQRAAPWRGELVLACAPPPGSCAMPISTSSMPPATISDPAEQRRLDHDRAPSTISSSGAGQARGRLVEPSAPRPRHHAAGATAGSPASCQRRDDGSAERRDQRRREQVGEERHPQARTARRSFSPPRSAAWAACDTTSSPSPATPAASSRPAPATAIPRCHERCPVRPRAARTRRRPGRGEQQRPAPAARSTRARAPAELEVVRVDRTTGTRRPGGSRRATRGSRQAQRLEQQALAYRQREPEARLTPDQRTMALADRPREHAPKCRRAGQRRDHAGPRSAGAR